MDRIVVGFDGSEHSLKALARAADLANSAEIVVVSAAGPHLLRHAPGEIPVDTQEEEARDAALAEARRYLEQRGLTGRYVEGHGSPADVIVQEAQESKADLIVVGTHGHNAVERAVLGSVSTEVVHHAPCDVLIVR